MRDLPARLLDRPAPEVVRWFALVRLHELIVVRHRLDDPDDTAALHDFRVALRRLRTLLRAYRQVLADSLTRKSRRRLGRLAAASGPSRNSEVWLQLLHESGAASAADAPGIEWIERELARNRRTGDRQLRRALDRDFADVAAQLQRRLQRYRVTHALGETTWLPPARVLVAQTIAAGALALQESLEAPQRSSDGEALHQTRIAAKRLRYTLEVLIRGGLAPIKVLQTTATAIAQLAVLQDRLGRLHDVLTFEHWLADRIAEEAARRARKGSALGGTPETELPVGGTAEDTAPPAFVKALRRRLHAEAARQTRFLTSAAFRRQTDRLIRRVDSVAGRLNRRRPAVNRPAATRHATGVTS